MLIYQLPVSLSSYKVRLALRFKGADLVLHEPPEGSYRSPRYRAINPAGTIPALVGPQGLLAESDAIIEYLDDMGIGRPLRPADAWLAARQRMLSRWCELRLESAVRRLFAHTDQTLRKMDAVAEIDTAIAAALALIEGELDAEGPFALSSDPGLADCGLTATLAWLAPLGPLLGLSATAGPRLARAALAVAAHPAVEAEVSAYHALVAARAAAWS